MNQERPFKLLNCKKYEKEVNVYETLSVFPQLIPVSKKQRIISNGIKHPEKLFEAPCSIAKQVITAQESAGISDENCRGRRTYCLLYVVKKEEYPDLSTYEVEQIIEEYKDLYSEFQSIFIIKTMPEGIYIYAVFNNFSMDGERKMTSLFNPFVMQRLLQKHKSKNKGEKL